MSIAASFTAAKRLQCGAATSHPAWAQYGGWGMAFRIASLRTGCGGLFSGIADLPIFEDPQALYDVDVGEDIIVRCHRKIVYPNGTIYNGFVDTATRMRAGNIVPLTIVLMDSEDDPEISMRLAILNNMSRHVSTGATAAAIWNH